MSTLRDEESFLERGSVGTTEGGTIAHGEKSKGLKG